jgi:hypothetical protein
MDEDKERDHCPRCGFVWWPGDRVCRVCDWEPAFGEPVVPWTPEDDGEL